MRGERYPFTFTCFDHKVGIASSMTGWGKNHNADNLVSAFMIRLNTTTLERYKLLRYSSDRTSLEENECREREAVQVEEVSVANEGKRRPTFLRLFPRSLPTGSDPNGSA